MKERCLTRIVQPVYQVFMLHISIILERRGKPLGSISTHFFSVKILMWLFSSDEPGLEFVINEDNTSVSCHLSYSLSVFSMLLKGYIFID